MSKQCPFSYIEFADLNFGRVLFHPSTRKTCEKAAPFPESVPHALHQKIRAPHCGTRIFGGDEEDRTLDLTDANRTLSQLSYAPKCVPMP